MRDLTDLLDEALAARASLLHGLQPASMARIRSRVRRRRTARHTMQVLAILPVAAALAFGGWLLLGGRAIPPAESPTPQPSVSSTPDAIPDDEPITRDGLPPYHPMPQGLLEQTRTGWLVAVQRPTTVDDAGAAEVVANAVFLIDRNATHYLLAELPVEQYVEPVHWAAGESRARVRMQVLADGQAFPLAEAMAAGWLDLRTGELVRDESIPLGAAFLGRGDDGIELWRGSDDTLLRVQDGDVRTVAQGARHAFLSPDGGAATLPAPQVWADSIRILDVVAGDVRTVPLAVPDGQLCVPAGWLRDGEPMVKCVDQLLEQGDTTYSHPRLYAVAPDDGGLRLLVEIPEGDPSVNPWTARHVRDGAVAFTLASDAGGCDLGVGFWNGERIVAVQTAQFGDEVFTIGSTALERIYATEARGCGGPPSPAGLVGYSTEVDGGTGVVQAPEGSWLQGLSGWAVAE